MSFFTGNGQGLSFELGTIEANIIPNPKLFDLLKEELDRGTIIYDGPALAIVPVEAVIESDQLVQLQHAESNQPFNVMFRTPTNLLPGDLCLLDTRTGKLLAVKCGEEIIYYA